MARLRDWHRTFGFHDGGEFYQTAHLENCTVVFQGHTPPLGSLLLQPRLCKCPDSALLTKGQDPRALGPMEEREVVIVNINGGSRIM